MKKLSTIIATLFVACAASLSAAAEELTTHLTVNLHDGTTEHFNLLDTPTVTMADHQVVVSSESLQGTYEFEAVSHFSFSKRATSSISDMLTDDASFAFTYVDNATVVIAAPALEWAKVYTTDGRQVAEGVADADHTVTLHVSNLTPGIYIVAPSCHSAIKIVKR